MRKIFSLLGLLCLGVFFMTTAQACSDALNFEVRPLNSKTPVKLCDVYQNKVILIVNTASQCGYTPQYEGLETLYKKYKDKGLVILGFPSNDFGGQEPDSEDKIQTFCRSTYGIEFPMFEKVGASEKNAHPLFKALAAKTGEFPQWNFHKYLINRQGDVIQSFPSKVKPESEELIKAIEKLL